MRALLLERNELVVKTILGLDKALLTYELLASAAARFENCILP